MLFCIYCWWFVAHIFPPLTFFCVFLDFVIWCPRDPPTYPGFNVELICRYERFKMIVSKFEVHIWSYERAKHPATSLCYSVIQFILACFSQADLILASGMVFTAWRTSSTRSTLLAPTSSRSSGLFAKKLFAL